MELLEWLLDQNYWFLFHVVVLLGLSLFLMAMTMTKDNTAPNPGENPRPFIPKAQVSAKDQVLLDMLDPFVHNYVITDPALPDNPIIYASEAFCSFTEYPWEEIEGRNCRFLQKEGDTDKTDIARIRSAISDAEDANVCLRNFKKSGTPFNNQFFLCALREEGKGRHNVLYHLGVQHEVDEIKRGQAPANAGWVYSVGSRERGSGPPRKKFN